MGIYVNIKVTIQYLFRRNNIVPYMKLIDFIYYNNMMIIII